MNRSVAFFAARFALVFTLAGCGGGNQSSNTSAEATAAANGAATAGAAVAEGASPAGAGNGGAITIAGSTALLPLVKQAATDYQATHPNAQISVSGGGSRVGITQAAQGGLDIGDSDIPAPTEPSLVDHKVAAVRFDVVVNPDVGVTKLTKQQIHDIFTGKVTNWKDVGGKDQAITIINRPRSSGTRAVFVQKLMGGTQPLESGLTQDSSGTVATMVGQTPGAVSYLAASYVKPGQQTAVAIDGVDPTDANVESGTYPFWSYEHMFTKGQPKSNVGDFIVFVSKDANALKSLGFIDASKVKEK